jgi:hypothetical protein
MLSTANHGKMVQRTQEIGPVTCFSRRSVILVAPGSDFSRNTFRQRREAAIGGSG